MFSCCSGKLLDPVIKNNLHDCSRFSHFVTSRDNLEKPELRNLEVTSEHSTLGWSQVGH